MCGPLEDGQVGGTCRGDFSCATERLNHPSFFEICRLFQEPCFIGNKDFALILNLGQANIYIHFSVSTVALFMINGC